MSNKYNVALMLKKTRQRPFTSLLIGEVKTYIAARNLIDFQINITSQKH